MGSGAGMDVQVLSQGYAGRRYLLLAISINRGYLGKQN